MLQALDMGFSLFNLLILAQGIGRLIKRQHSISPLRIQY